MRVDYMAYLCDSVRNTNFRFCVSNLQIKIPLFIFANYNS